MVPGPAEKIIPRGVPGIGAVRRHWPGSYGGFAALCSSPVPPARPPIGTAELCTDASAASRT